ncbi:MAG: 3-methyl-2-oxobutanoate hydroxymethyltransferase [Flavobacteriales bacterium]|jgi:3-methyl-2-oxobutanoate hydroxymethyltransferase
MTYANIDKSYSESSLSHKISLTQIKKMKAEGKRFSVVALYDAQMAAMAQKSGIEVVLVGDSLGMTVMGFESTIPVTMEHMIYHVEAVHRGNDRSLIIGDLPFMAYANINQALDNSARIMRAGAHMVKLEGGEWLAPTIKALSERGIPVCAHIGLTPQSVHKFGGFRVQGRSDESAKKILNDALALEEAGADLVLLECVPAPVVDEISSALNVSTIGIGAGKNTDAQVLVINDILGLTPQPPKFSKNFLAETADIPSALIKFNQDVKLGVFPEKEHIFF